MCVYISAITPKEEPKIIFCKDLDEWVDVRENYFPFLPEDWRDVLKGNVDVNYFTIINQPYDKMIVLISTNLEKMQNMMSGIRLAFEADLLKIEKDREKVYSN